MLGAPNSAAPFYGPKSLSCAASVDLNELNWAPPNQRCNCKSQLESEAAVSGPKDEPTPLRGDGQLSRVPAALTSKLASKHDDRLSGAPSWAGGTRGLHHWLAVKSQRQRAPSPHGNDTLDLHVHTAAAAPPPRRRRLGIGLTRLPLGVAPPPFKTSKSADESKFALALLVLSMVGEKVVRNEQIRAPGRLKSQLFASDLQMEISRRNESRAHSRRCNRKRNSRALDTRQGPWRVRSCCWGRR